MRAEGTCLPASAGPLAYSSESRSQLAIEAVGDALHRGQVQLGLEAEWDREDRHAVAAQVGDLILLVASALVDGERGACRRSRDGRGGRRSAVQLGDP